MDNLFVIAFCCALLGLPIAIAINIDSKRDSSSWSKAYSTIQVVALTLTPLLFVLTFLLFPAQEEMLIQASTIFFSIMILFSSLYITQSSGQSLVNIAIWGMLLFVILYINNNPHIHTSHPDQHLFP